MINSQLKIGLTTALAVITVVTVLLQYARPIVDTDLWWHMSYGRFLVENWTLVLDHAQFTWTEVQEDSIYNAWAAEIFLYLLHDTGGLKALFILRYTCYFIFIGIMILSAKRLGVASEPLVWACILTSVAMAPLASYVKPEMFSFLLFSLLIAVWIYLKHKGDERQKLVYLLPVIILIWVNSHGGFIMGGLFLFMMFIGECLNYKFSPSSAFTINTLKHLACSILLCGVAILVTPYGIAYPLGIIESLFFGIQELDQGSKLNQIYAYRNIFAETAVPFNFREYLIIAVSILLTLFYRTTTRRRDYALILVNITFLISYVFVIRTTYFYAPVFCMTAIYLISIKSESSNVLFPFTKVVLILIVSIYVSYKAIYSTAVSQTDSGWLGFGIGYSNPVAEAAYLSRLPDDIVIGNDYTSGSYLQWALWPKKVFIDSRYFPFLGWYDSYVEFLQGRNVESFLKNNPADVWLLSYGNNILELYFLQSPDWELVFYGPSAAIVAKKSLTLPKAIEQSFESIQNIRSIKRGLLFIDFATKIGEIDAAYTALDGLNNTILVDEQSEMLSGIRSYVDGVAAYHNRNFQGATTGFEVSKTNGTLYSNAFLESSYHQLAATYCENHKLNEALHYAKKAWEIDPDDGVNLYNLGIVEHYALGSNQDSNLLRRFLSDTTPKGNIPAQIVNFTKELVAGKAENKTPQCLRKPPYGKPNIWGS